MIRPVLISLLAFVLFFSAAGQAVISGQIHLEDGEVAAGAIVQLLESDVVSLAAYVVSDTAGCWRLKGINNGKYVVQVTYLGCELWQEVLLVNTAKQYNFSISLKYKQKMLEGVEVKTDRLGLVVQGDTLYYDLKTYIDSTEYNLGDILQKLPQINVDANGGISYKGKRVDVVLTEGKDIFAQMHKQMIEGIRATDIKSVQIIENYKEGLDNIKQTNKDKVALNVQLTDTAKGKVLGNARGVTNFHSQYEAQGTIYNAGDKIGYTTLFRANNVAQPVMAPLDLLSIIDFENLKVEGSAKMDDLMPEGFITPIDTKKNNDIFGSVRLVGQPSERIKVKSLVYFAGFDRFSERLTIRSYLDNNTIFAGVKQSRVPANILFSDIKIEYKSKKGFYTSIYVPLTLSKNERRQTLASSLNERDFIDNFNLSNNTQAFVPSIKLGRSLKNKNAISIEIKSNIYKNHKISLSTSHAPIFGTIDSSIRQSIINRNRLIGAAVSFQSKINKYTTTYSIGLDHTIFDTDFDTDITQSHEWDLQSSIRSLQSYLEIQSRYEGKKVRYTASLNVTNLKRVFEKQRKYFFLIPSGSAGAYYNFSKTNSLFINAGLVSAPADLHSLIQVPQIRDAQTLTLEKLDSSYLAMRKYIEITYMNAEPSGKYDVRGNLRYSEQKNNIAYQTNIVNNYFINTSFLSPKTSTINISSDFRYRIKKLNTKLKLASGLDIVETFTPFDNKLFPTNLTRIYVDASLQLATIRSVLFIPGGRIEQNKQSSTQLNFGSKYQALKGYAAIQYKTAILFAKTNFSYQRNFIQKQTLDTWGLDFEIEYSCHKSPLKLNLIGRNMLNFRGTPILMYDFNPNYLGFERFVTAGGQIMAGINYIF